jgi:hypothetical protein
VAPLRYRDIHGLHHFATFGRRALRAPAVEPPTPSLPSPGACSSAVPFDRSVVKRRPCVNLNKLDLNHDVNPTT